MDVLKIRLLGGFEMERGGAVLPLPPTPKSRSLLAYLVLNRDRLVHREVVCALLWPDEDEAVARKALRTALWRIRSAIEAGGQSDGYIYSDAYQVGLRGDAPVWADVAEFERVIAGLDSRADDALEAADGESMIAAAQLYRGDFAAGVYDEWVLIEQARLRLAHLALLERIAAFQARRERWLQAIGWAERALACDPVREHLHRVVMSCHMSMGDRPSALRQYAHCEAALMNELGIEPMVETRQLRDSIGGGNGRRPGPPSKPRAKRAEKPEARLGREVDKALSTIRMAAKRLDRARGSGRPSKVG
ncbi:MAG TPA: BTAD domain-containing putative transcriptional regulator [Allosphingosinicella sp.]